MDDESPAKLDADEAPDNKGDPDALDRNPFEKTEDEKEGEHLWSLHGTCSTRHHKVLRAKLFLLHDVTNKNPPKTTGLCGYLQGDVHELGVP